MIYWRWSNRDGVCVDNRNNKTSAMWFLSIFGRNVIIQWPFKYFVWIFPQLCEHILPTISYMYRWTQGSIIKFWQVCRVFLGGHPVHHPKVFRRFRMEPYLKRSFWPILESEKIFSLRNWSLLCPINFRSLPPAQNCNLVAWYTPLTFDTIIGRM